MPRRSPYRIELSDEERVVLESLARSYTSPYWQVTRARMVLLAADGRRNVPGRLEREAAMSAISTPLTDDPLLMR